MTTQGITYKDTTETKFLAHLKKLGIVSFWHWLTAVNPESNNIVITKCKLAYTLELISTHCLTADEPRLEGIPKDQLRLIYLHFRLVKTWRPKNNTQP